MPQLDAVLPLIPRDYPRFTLLARSLERFLGDLGSLWIVVPDTARTDIQRQVNNLPLPVQVVAESDWAPGLGKLPTRGWYKQQLLKLVASEFVEGDFYLTLDADVICTRRCGYAELVPGGKARCHVLSQSDHQDWYDGAEALLGVSAVRRNVLHNVTPVVWSTAGVKKTVAHLNERAERQQWGKGIRGLRQRAHSLLARNAAAPWMNYLAPATPWAEYALYFTYLEATGQFDEYHVESDLCIYDVRRSLWKNTKTLEGWDPTPLFEGDGPPYFAVLQSNAELPVTELWQRLETWLGPQPN